MSASPATQCKNVTPSDSTDLPFGPCRALFVGNGGNVVIQSAVVASERADITLQNVSSGQVLPVGAARVKATGTTATGIVALY